MKKIDPALLAALSLNTTEEEQFLITEKEAEMLSRGELTFHNGRLYRTENLIPQKVAIADLAIEGVPPLNLYGNQTQRPKLPIETQVVIEQLTHFLQWNEDANPYIWVEQAQMLAEFAGEGSKPFLLDILNSAIPLKEGMKLEGFSSKEFSEKYLYYRPSLLEQAEQEMSQVDPEYKPIFNMIDAKTHENLGPLNLSAEDLIPRPVDTNQVVENPTFISLELEGMRNSHVKELEQLLKAIYRDYQKDRTETFEQFTECASKAYSEYDEHINMLDPDDFDPEITKWQIALHLQDVYWEAFRGRTITILKLFNKFLNPDNKLYHLETPIIGMKKR